MGMQDEKTVVVKAFSYKGIPVIEKAVADLEGLKTDVRTGKTDFFSAMERSVSDWDQIFAAAREAGKIPADYTNDEDHCLEYNPDSQELRIVN